MLRIIGNYLRADRYGVYIWTPRFLFDVMWPLRFWSIRYQRGPEKYHAGNIRIGPLHAAWYDRAATQRI